MSVSYNIINITDSNIKKLKFLVLCENAVKIILMLFSIKHCVFLILEISDKSYATLLLIVENN